MLRKLLMRPIKRKVKGVVGEAIASGWGALALPSSTYARLSDITLPTPDGTTQIDLVIVSRFGVFVIEVKNMSGWIFGDETNRQWTQVFRNGETVPLPEFAQAELPARQGRAGDAQAARDPEPHGPLGGRVHRRCDAEDAAARERDGGSALLEVREVLPDTHPDGRRGADRVQGPDHRAPRTDEANEARTRPAHTSEKGPDGGAQVPAMRQDNGPSHEPPRTQRGEPVLGLYRLPELQSHYGRDARLSPALPR